MAVRDVNPATKVVLTTRIDRRMAGSRQGSAEQIKIVCVPHFLPGRLRMQRRSGAGGFCALYALFTGGVDTGWTFYTPLSSNYAQGHVVAAGAFDKRPPLGGGGDIDRGEENAFGVFRRVGHQSALVGQAASLPVLSLYAKNQLGNDNTGRLAACLHELH